MFKIIIFSLILFFSSSFTEIDKSSKLDSQDEIIKNLVSPNLIGQYNLKVMALTSTISSYIAKQINFPTVKNLPLKLLIK